jgi:hypothetical protein
MSGKFSYALKEAYGYQHCHGDDCDEFYFRPLIMGKEMFTYVAHLPPGGGLYGDEGEAQHFEQSIFVLSGEVTVFLGKDHPEEAETKHTVGPFEAFICRRGEPWGKWNLGDTPVSYVCTFTWLPKATTPEEFLELVKNRGGEFFTPEEMNAMAGELLED